MGGAAMTPPVATLSNLSANTPPLGSLGNNQHPSRFTAVLVFFRRWLLDAVDCALVGLANRRPLDPGEQICSVCQGGNAGSQTAAELQREG